MKNKKIPTFEITIEVNNNLFYRIVKRLFDIVVSTLGMIILSPIFLIVALLVKLTSKGPVFYVSDRIGRYGYTFKFYKFRSMTVDADEQLIYDS